MKKLIVILLVFSGFNAFAQEEPLFTLDAKKISENETPINVLAAIREDFPEGDVVDYYLLPASQVDSEWAVTVEDNLKPDEVIDHYTVLLKGKKGGYIYSLYDKNGNLKMTKILALDFALPSSIRTASTTGKYDGYQVQSDKYFKLTNKRTDKEYVEVIVAKGNDKKKLYFTPEGEFIKEK